MRTLNATLPATGGINADSARHAIVWLMMASSFVVLIEPAPTDFLFFLAFALFLTSGLSVSAAVMPMVLFMLLFLLGGFFSLIPVYNDFESVKYLFVSVYMGLMSLFFALYIIVDPERRSRLIFNGWTTGAAIASVLGIAGALDIAGSGELMSLQGRAQGLFKDPNVYSTFVILPAVYLTHNILLGGKRHGLARIAVLLLILAGLFLSFSRGAWLNFMLAVALMIVIEFILAQSAAVRMRMMLIIGLGFAALIGIIALLLSIESVRSMFFDRLTLTKSYDVGETGRFGNQLASLPLLLVSPNGFGPLQFRNVVYIDPHNVYLNGFASYGWLGGFSYLLLVLSTIVAGIRSVIGRTPFHSMAVVAVCVFISTAFQGIQIDTDHWRHFYWLLGLVWGLYAAGQLHLARHGLRA